MALALDDAVRTGTAPSNHADDLGNTGAPILASDPAGASVARAVVSRGDGRPPCQAGARRLRRLRRPGERPVIDNRNERPQG